jgi:hypothetical protein
MTFSKIQTRTMFVLFTALLLLFGTSSLAHLSGRGEILGRVTDPVGAVIPDVTVVATSTTRGVQENLKRLLSDRQFPVGLRGQRNFRWRAQGVRGKLPDG